MRRRLRVCERRKVPRGEPQWRLQRQRQWWQQEVAATVDGIRQGQALPVPVPVPMRKT